MYLVTGFKIVGDLLRFQREEMNLKIVGITFNSPDFNPTYLSVSSNSTGNVYLSQEI
jgi:hypothetical protein